MDLQAHRIKITTKQIVIMAMFGAMAAVLMVFEVQIPFAPTFVKLDVSDLPIIIGGFIYGPFIGIGIACIKIVLNLVLNGTTTMFVGELSNLILSIAHMLPTAIIYQKSKTKKSALIGLFTGTVVASVLAIISNLFIIFPLYSSLFNLSMDSIVEMAVATNPLVNDLLTMILFSLLPFNIFKFTIVSLITIIIYKKINVVLKRF